MYKSLSPINGFEVGKVPKLVSFGPFAIIAFPVLKIIPVLNPMLVVSPLEKRPT